MEENEKTKVLIVDDERSNIIALAEILNPIYDILVAKDGRTAIRVAKENHPDLILLDVLMPEMSGFEVLVKLKNTDHVREIPVIFITGLSSVEDEEKGFLLGAVDYIKKPFNSTIVKVRVKTHLQIMNQMHTIENLSKMDGLTNLPNRRSFDCRIKEEWDKCVNSKHPIGILMIDVDNFKEYNDTYGHPQGDMLLQSIANVFRQSLKRESDFIARWGGEEFVVLLPNTNLNGALEVADQIRENVEHAIIPCFDGSDTSITVSIGVHSEAPSNDVSVTGFITKADQALYQAKDIGKNRVCSYMVK